MLSWVERFLPTRLSLINICHDFYVATAKLSDPHILSLCERIWGLDNCTTAIGRSEPLSSSGEFCRALHAVGRVSVFHLKVVDDWFVPWL